MCLRISYNIGVETRKAVLEDLPKLIDLYAEFTYATNGIGKPSQDSIVNNLFGCFRKGLLYVAQDAGEFVGIIGGIYEGKEFWGRIAYIKPKYRSKLYRLISPMFHEVKKTADTLHIFVVPERVKLWNKIGCEVHRVWLRRNLK